MTTLSPEHERALLAAAVDIELAKEHGVHSARGGIVFPYRCPSGRVVEQLRPDDGKPRKYMFPKGEPACLNQLPTRGETREVWLVEGTKQALAAASYAPDGVQVLGVAGCWNFQAKGVPLPGLDMVRGKRVVIIQDADAATNSDVYRAGVRQAEMCAELGAASVGFCQLRTVPDIGEKGGIDDALGAVRSHPARCALLLALTSPEQLFDLPAPEPPAAKDAEPAKASVPTDYVEGRPTLPDGSPDTLAKLAAPKLKRERLVGATDRLFGLSGSLWSEVKDAPELYSAVEQFSGALYMRPEKGKGGAVYLAPTGLVQLSTKLVKSIGESLKMQHSDEGFFNTAPVGVAFRDTFVGPGIEEPLSGDHRQRQALAWKFMPDVELERDAPMFHCALSQWFDGDPDAEEKALCLCEFAGLALIGGFGPATLGRSNIQTAVMNLGEGANGKSVFLELLSSMLPPEYVSNVAPQDMGNEYYRDMLAGKRANICPEIPEREVIAAGNLKAVISCDPGMTARAPYGKPYSFQPTAGHIYSANTLPRFSDTSGGFMRRWIVVQWNNVVPENRRDPGLCRKLREHEGAAIASWFVLRGVEAFERGRLTVPRSSEAAKSTWAGDSDQVIEYREERLVRMPEGARQVDWSPVGELYRDYCAWAQLAGHRFPLGRRQFAKRLERVGGAAQAKQGGCARLPFRLREHDAEHDREEF